MFIEYVEGQKYPAKNAEISDSLSGFKDAGYILKDNEIVVDIDVLDHEAIKDLIERFNICTETVWTDRGAHLYFEMPTGFRRNQGIIPLGFKVEYKSARNTKSVTVKRNGIERQIDNKDKRQKLPKIFWAKAGRKQYENLLGMQEGEGRNNALFKQKHSLQEFPEWRDILIYINEHVFAEPMDNKELNTLLKDDPSSSEVEEESSIADLIMEEHKTVRYCGQIYYYSNERYIADEEKLDQLVYSYCYGRKTKFEEEVLKQVKKRSRIVRPSQTFKIKFKNGVLHNGRFDYVEYDGFTPYYLDVNYNPDATPVAEVDNYLDHLSNGNAEYRQRILEVMAHCLITDKEFKRLLAKFFIFVGDGGNGKGTLLQVIRNILGPENCGALSIRDMKDERYLNQLDLRLCNLGDDIHDAPIDLQEMKLLKNISTCDTIATRKLYENASIREFHCTLIFTSNHVIKSFEKGFSYKRRVDWMPMFTRVEKKDNKFITKLTTPEAREYWIKLIIDAYKRLYENECFTPCSIIEDYNEHYHLQNNNTIEFVMDLSESDIDMRNPKELYDDYKVWCEENSENPLSQKHLRETVQSIWGYESKVKKIGGRSRRVFVKTDKGKSDEMLQAIRERIIDDESS